jgi:hypothetical protein
MTWHVPAQAGGPRLTHRADLAVRLAAAALFLAGTAFLIAGTVNSGIAFALVAIGAALLVIEQLDQRR